MRLSLGMVLTGLASLALGAVPVAPAKPELIAETRAAVLAAFSTPDALRQTTILSAGLAIGPRLWAASKEARKPYMDDTKDTYGFVPTPEIVAQWKLETFDVAAFSDPTMRSVLTEASKEGTPVLSGAIFKRKPLVLSSIVLSQVKPEEFPFTVRRPTEDEVVYYYAIIPYDLSEPMWVVKSNEHAFLCHFGNDGKLFFIEML